MKQVTGFLTEDWTFFDNKAAAELHEAEHLLDHSARYIGIDPEKLKDAISQLHEPVRRYLDAKDACTVSVESSVESESTEHIEYVDGLPIARAASSRLDREDTGQSQTTSSDLLNKPPRRG